jgi:microsomal dipeptidase-like Zn-dependent dipeptidase
MQVGTQVPLEPKGTAVEHVVFFPSSDGTPAFRRLPSFEEAVRLVEHLRNVEGVEHVTVHALTEVPLNFRAYYRVEVPAAAEAPAVPSQQALVGQAPAVEVPAVEPAAHTVVPLDPQQVEAQQAEAQQAEAQQAEAQQAEAQQLEAQQLEAQQAQARLAEAAQAAAQQAAGQGEAPVQDAPALELVPELPVQAASPEPAAASSNGQGRDGVRSLGFFA